MEKNKIHIYLYNAFIVLCLLGGAVYVVSQFMHFGSGEFTDNARVQMENAMREDNRFKNLLSQDAVTRQQYDEVHTGYLRAKAAYEQAVRSRQMQSAVVTEQGHQLSVSEQGIELARRAVDLARLNLSYCYIIATCNGTVGMKNIHAGQLVNPGQTLVSIVDNGERWIEANYKESQLPHIKVGNKAEITVDAVPGIQYTGTVERISDATGSAFSLIPIDNATGNFVKVEQRVTVRIKLDENDDVARLKSGYNVECIVKE